MVEKEKFEKLINILEISLRGESFDQEQADLLMKLIIPTMIINSSWKFKNGS
jgi:hypothetical protein